MINRKAAPAVNLITEIKLPAVDQIILRNGVQLHAINSGQQEVLKLELIFEAGRWHELQRGVASATSRMLLEGTHKKSALQIAEELDFYGATLGADASVDWSIITLYCLNKHAERLFQLLHELLNESVFPEKELSVYVQNGKQRIAVNQEKVEFHAQKKFAECLYGKNHPAGYTTSEEDFDLLRSDLLISFSQQRFHAGCLRIILSGKISNEVIKFTELNFGEERKGTTMVYPEHTRYSTPERKQFIEKKNAVQSAIRIGRPIIGKTHPDYPALRVLNTVLGGYFGSRLMSNLREEKGYCYGVHSGIASYLHDAHFYIGTEVGRESTSGAVDEIYREMNRLMNEPVSEPELETVRKYMLGTYLSETDGPFNASEILRGLLLFGLDSRHYQHMISTTQSVDSETLMTLARNYLSVESMTEVVSGNLDS